MTTPTPQRPLPHLTSWNRPFFSAGFEDVLRLQYCHGCERHIYYPRPLCPRCGRDDLEWADTSGVGTLYSYTIVHRPEHPFFLDDVPIIMATVALREGPLMFARLEDADEQKLTIGQNLSVGFAPLTDEIALPVFRIAP